MKKFILCFILLITSLFSCSAQRVVIQLGTPCYHEYYEYRHYRECPPPRVDRYYYAPRPCDRGPFIHEGGPRPMRPMVGPRRGR